MTSQASGSSRRLAEISVAVTRAEPVTRALRKRLEAHGARVLGWPSVEIEVLDLGDAPPSLDGFDWIAFTSARAVVPVIRRWHELPDGVRVAAVGSATAAALQAAGWRVDHCPARFSVEDLIGSLAAAHEMFGARVLYPASSLAPDTLARGLEAFGARVERMDVYETRPAKADGRPWVARIEAGEVDVVTFTSPSAVDGFALSVGQGQAVGLLEQVLVVALGPRTAEALERFQRHPDRVARTNTLDGLVDAVIAAVAERDAKP